MRRSNHRLAALVAVAAVLGACASGAVRSTWTQVALAETPQPTASPPQQPMSSMAAAAAVITVTAHDLYFEPTAITVPAAGTYLFVLDDKGLIGHDLTFPSGVSIKAEPGTASDPVAVEIPAEGTDFWCAVPGHKDAGMVGHISVAGGPAASMPAGASPMATKAPDSHGGPPPAVPGVEPDPNAPAYTLYPAEAPALAPGDTHDIELRVVEKMMTVAPGYQVAVWTFNGTAPGPVIRVKVGDTVRVHLVNPATNQLSHSVDFHASQVAWNDEMLSIAPGQDKMYEWRADYAGVWMYHCGTSPALHHIANGMYGMVIVEPRSGLPNVDREFALVQSEWYIDAQGQPASLAKARAGAPSPDFVVFNGVANQYTDHHLMVGTGERVRFFILDAGPSIDSSFHIVGTIFDRVIKEGVLMDAATNGGWASQAVDLSPAQGAIIETTTAEDGLYPIVTHAFNLVGRGALGLLQAGDGDPLN